jgi:hypothetical protein
MESCCGWLLITNVNCAVGTNMLIIAVCHGYTADKPFTKSFPISHREMDPPTRDAMFAFLVAEGVELSHIDEMIAIYDDRVIEHIIVTEDDDPEEEEEEYVRKELVNA